MERLDGAANLDCCLSSAAGKVTSTTIELGRELSQTACLPKRPRMPRTFRSGRNGLSFVFSLVKGFSILQHQKHAYPFLVCFIGVMFLVCSCGSTSGSSVIPADSQPTVAAFPPTRSLPASTPTSIPLIFTPTPVPPVLTSCPATGTARAAIMPPLPVGSHQAVLYTSNSTPTLNGNSTSILRRYDPLTGQQADVFKITVPVKLLNNQELTDAIEDMGTSDNGQWIVFKTAIEGKEAIQMVRSDGQELQTLYCTTMDKDLGDTFSLSPDTKYLAFDEFPISSLNNQNLVVVDLTTGTLHVAATANSDASGFYEPIKWQDNTSLYVSYSRVGVDYTRNRRQVYLLPDVTQSSSLQQITIPTIAGASNDMCKDIDFSPDTTQLLVSDCTATINQDIIYSGPSTIETIPLAGGTPHIIYTSQSPIIFARFITNTTIWFSLNDGLNGSQNSMWKINSDGSGLTRLTTQSVRFELHGYSSTMHVSHDNSWFAFVNSAYFGPSTLIFGSMDGSSSHTISVDGDNDALVGWTTY